MTGLHEEVVDLSEGVDLVVREQAHLPPIPGRAIVDDEAARMPAAACARVWPDGRLMEVVRRGRGIGLAVS